ncbi:hypothetical protein GOBAR_AA19105 [Gossypium barbadense]|uniref:Uncharacterized protein n=1 Tax=Gossypium barbadense TaxID=3634 RepID=A0A2P5XE02_GOSBA|nr:hypothetical protein GOBAR_AA19105 [Gossypium barbadense]
MGQVTQDYQMSFEMYGFLPTREAIGAPKLACDLNYMPLFKIQGKPGEEFTTAYEEAMTGPYTSKDWWGGIVSIDRRVFHELIPCPEKCIVAIT